MQGEGSNLRGSRSQPAEAEETGSEAGWAVRGQGDWDAQGSTDCPPEPSALPMQRTRLRVQVQSVFAAVPASCVGRPWFKSQLPLLLPWALGRSVGNSRS